MLKVLGKNSVKVFFWDFFWHHRDASAETSLLFFGVENEIKVVDLNSDVKMEHPIPDRVRAVEVIHCFVLFFKSSNLDPRRGCGEHGTAPIRIPRRTEPRGKTRRAH